MMESVIDVFVGGVVPLAEMGSYSVRFTRGGSTDAVLT
jgi:hypothetical protein